jgi:hypothetical protein
MDWHGSLNLGGRRIRGWRRLVPAITACAGLVGSAGCGPGGPALEPATGVVTLDGQPVDAATVTLAPAGGGGGIASAITDAAGRFAITTVVPGLGARAGIAAGDYAVTVTKVTSAAAGAPASDDPGFVPPVPENAAPKITYLVPKGYGTAATSGLRATIAKGRNDLTFALDSKFKP